MSDSTKEGVIISLDPKGFGFMKVEGRMKNLFFHAKELMNAEFDELQVGDKLSFTHIATTEKGDQAKEVDLMEA